MFFEFVVEVFEEFIIVIFDEFGNVVGYVINIMNEYFGCYIFGYDLCKIIFVIFVRCFNKFFLWFYYLVIDFSLIILI